MLGGVAEVVSSNPTVGHKNIFSAFTGIVDLLPLSLYIYICNAIYGFIAVLIMIALP